MLWLFTFAIGTLFVGLLWLQHHCGVKLEPDFLALEEKEIEKELWHR